MALDEKERGVRGDDGGRSERTFEVGVRGGYRFLRRGAGPLEERFEWCPPYYGEMEVHNTYSR